MSGYRIALGSLFTECNHLGGRPIDIARFEQCELKRGDGVLNASGAVVGMTEVLRAGGAEIVPLLVATAHPGGPLTSGCHAQLKGEMLERLREALPVDGVLLSLHGSAAAEDCGDVEGDLLQAVRSVVGEGVPIVATLDPHAHVTTQMVHNADALLAFETYPHVDARETGVRGARLLLETLDGAIRPRMALAKVPVLVSGVHGSTEGDGPFARVMNFAKAQEGRDGVLSTSVFLVHPYLDLPEMGGGGLVITDGDDEKAESLACEIAGRYWDERFALEPQVFSPSQAIARGLETLKPGAGPVLLVECADCAGGGAAGDSVHTLRALLEADLTGLSLAPVVDPQAAQQCHAAGEGAVVTVDLGHKLDPQWGEPLSITGRVLRLSDGRFTYSGGVWKGVEGNMGPCAILQAGNVHILITTDATYDWADEQFRALGLEAAEAQFIVVKNPMNYRLGYAGIATAAFILDTPGPTPATLRGVQHRNLQPPYFPAHADIPNLRPTVASSSSFALQEIA